MLKQTLLLLATLAAALAADEAAVPVSAQPPVLQTDPVATEEAPQPRALDQKPEAIEKAAADEEADQVSSQPPVRQTSPVVTEEAPQARALDLKPAAVEKVAAEERAVPISAQPPVRLTSPVQQVDNASDEELQQDEERPVSVPIIRSLHNVGDMDNWQESFRYELPDGTLREESLKFRSVGDARVPVVRGRSVWMGGDGKRIEMLYEADENGFRAYGDHLPREAGQEAVRPPDSRRESISVVVNTPPPAPKPAPPSPVPPRKARPWATLQHPLPSPTPLPTPSPSSTVPSRKLAGRRWV